MGGDQGLRTEISGPGAIAPGNVLPGTSHEILMPARKVAARLVAKMEESLNAARQIRVVPSGHMQRGNLNGAKPLRDVHGRPIFARAVVIEPIEHVPRQTFAVQRRMIAKGEHTSL